MTIHFLREHAKHLQDNAEVTSIKAKSNPNDFLLQLAALNQTEAANAVKSDLLLAEAEEVGELIDLRFLGPRANGSMALDSFIKIAQPLSKAWKFAAHRLRYGTLTDRVKSEIGEALNLKLAGMSYGSTRLFLTGNGRADLTGSNLLHETLIQTFRLLNSTNEEFYDAIDAVGGQAANHFGEVMKAIDDAGFAAEFSWHTPVKEFFWRGLPDELVRIRTLLDTIKEPEIYTETISGLVAGILDTGRLDIRTEEGKLTIRYPLKLTQYVQKLAIAKPASIKVQTSKYWDAVSKRDIFKRQMIELGDIPLD